MEYIQLVHNDFSDLINEKVKEIMEKIIDYGFKVFENEDFFDFVSYEFEGEELEKIISKYFKKQGVEK